MVGGPRQPAQHHGGRCYAVERDDDAVGHRRDVSAPSPRPHRRGRRRSDAHRAVRVADRRLLPAPARRAGDERLVVRHVSRLRPGLFHWRLHRRRGDGRWWCAPTPGRSAAPVADGFRSRRDAGAHYCDPDADRSRSACVEARKHGGGAPRLHRSLCWREPANFRHVESRLRSLGRREFRHRRMARDVSRAYLRVDAGGRRDRPGNTHDDGGCRWNARRRPGCRRSRQARSR